MELAGRQVGPGGTINEDSREVDRSATQLTKAIRSHLVAQPRLLLEGGLHDADGGRHHAEAAGAAGRGRLGALEAEGLLCGGAYWWDVCGAFGSRLHWIPLI